MLSHLKTIEKHKPDTDYVQDFIFDDNDKDDRGIPIWNDTLESLIFTNNDEKNLKNKLKKKWNNEYKGYRSGFLDEITFDKGHFYQDNKGKNDVFEIFVKYFFN